MESHAPVQRMISKQVFFSFFLFPFSFSSWRDVDVKDKMPLDEYGSSNTRNT